MLYNKVTTITTTILANNENDNINNKSYYNFNKNTNREKMLIKNK